MNRYFLVGLLISLIACTDRPKGDVCNLNDQLSVFMCATSKLNIYKSEIEYHQAFFVSSELGKRATPNLTEVLKKSLTQNMRIDIGGYQSNETKKVVLEALSNINKEKISLSNLYVVYFGPEKDKPLILSAFGQAGATAEYVTFGL